MSLIFSIEEILPQALKKMGVAEQFTIQSIYAHWPEIVGPEIAIHTHPRAMHNKILFVSVNTSTWSHHLTMMKEQIIVNLNHFAKEKAVEDIRFQGGYWEKKQNTESTVQPEFTLKDKLQTVTIDTAQQANIKNISDMIADEQLQRKIYQLLMKDTALQELKKRENWHKCAGCSTLCPPNEKYCTVCAVKKRQATMNRIRNLLWEVPWITSRECRQYIECTELQFHWAKKELIDLLIEKSASESEQSVYVATLVMLLNRVKPDQLSNELIRGTLKGVRRKKHVFTHRS